MDDYLHRMLKIETSCFADVMERQGVVSQHIQNMTGHIPAAGIARTARAVPGDADSVLYSVLNGVEGEMIVVDWGGVKDIPGVGDLVVSEAVRRKLSGIVINGPIRDVAKIRKLGFPVFATGKTPAGGRHGQLGDLQVPVSIGGVQVRPGDFVLGDEDGLVVVPQERITELLEKAEAISQQDESVSREVLAGTPLDEIPRFKAYIETFTQ